MRTRKAVAAAVVAILMATAAMSGGTMAATPTIDTETSNTSYQSEISSDTELSGFNASASNESTVVVEGDNSTSPTMEVTVNGSDTVLLSNSSFDNQTAGSWGTTWNATFSHDDLHDAERGINDNVTMDLTVHDGNESNSTTVQFYLNTTNEFTVENLDDVDADEDTDDAPVTVETVDNTFFDTNIGILDITSTDFSTLEVEEREVDGQDTDVVLVFSNSSVADDASAAVASDVEDGDALYGLPLLVTGDDEGTSWIRVYHEEVPDDVDEDDDTYGVYHEGGIGGEDGIVINLGEQYEDEEEVDVTGTLNAGRITQIRHSIRTSDLNPFAIVFNGGNFLIGLGFVAGAPTARRRPVEEVIVTDGEE